MSTQDSWKQSLYQCVQRIRSSPEDWTERREALLQLNCLFDTLRLENKSQSIPNDIWNELKCLKICIHDLRSQIVKEVCNLLVTIAHTTRDTMAPFMREMLPALLEVCGSGNKLCGSCCTASLYSIVSCTSVRSGNLKFLVDTLEENKNKFIRLCCIKSLRLNLATWSAHLDRSDIYLIEKAVRNSLNDASETCRTEAYTLFTVFQQKFPKKAQTLFSLLDYKIQFRLENLKEDHTTDLIYSEQRTPSESQDRLEVQSCSLSIGDRVCVPASELFGYVRYIGPIDDTKGVWIGIELDEACGKNDGTVKGKRYFNCKSDHGIFTRQRQVILTMKAHAGEKDELSEDFIEAEAQPNSASSIASIDLEGPLHPVLRNIFSDHRSHIENCVNIIRSELIEHHRFEQVAATASSADAIAFLQQLQHNAQEKIKLSDAFIQRLIEAQLQARKS